jgi:dihydropteroate synthase
VTVPRPPVVRLGGRAFDDAHPVVMGIVNPTPDSFYDGGRAYRRDDALRLVEAHVAAGADVVDIGGVRAGPGRPVDTDEEKRRTVGLVALAAEEFPDTVVSIDTWRPEVAQAAVEAGARLINDAWGYDPRMPEVAGAHDVGLVCTHTANAVPREYTLRFRYADLVGEVRSELVRRAERAEELGVPRAGILIDPSHDFAKNTWHSLELTRRLGELVDTGWPVLVSVSNKDFIGEALGVAKDQRLEGTLATIAVCAWLGARVFRVHHVRESRRALDMVATIQGSRLPVKTLRALM